MAQTLTLVIDPDGGVGHIERTIVDADNTAVATVLYDDDYRKDWDENDLVVLG